MEALGVVWAVKHFRHYLYGHHCDVLTDHEALKSLLNTPHPSGQLARWGLALQEVFYCPGKGNVQADALYHSPIIGGDEQSVAEKAVVAALQQPSEQAQSPQQTAKSGEAPLAMAQRADPKLLLIMEYLVEGTLPADNTRARELALARQQYVLVEGVLHHDHTLRAIPPATSREQLFHEVHSGPCGAHLREAKIFGPVSWHENNREDF